MRKLVAFADLVNQIQTACQISFKRCSVAPFDRVPQIPEQFDANVRRFDSGY